MHHNLTRLKLRPYAEVFGILSIIRKVKVTSSAWAVYSRNFPGAVALATGAGLAQILNIAAAPILSRLYSPADFGLLAWFTSTAAVVATIVTGRYETAVLLPKENSQAIRIVQLALVCTVLATGFLATAVWLVPNAFYNSFKIGTFASWLPLAVTCGGLTAAFAVLSAWQNRHGAFRLLSISRISQIAAAVGIAIVLGWLDVVTGQIWAYIVATGIITLILARQSNCWRPLPRISELAEVARMHAAAPKYILPSALLGTITQQLPVYLITLWFSTALAGQFSVAWQILSLPIRLIGDAVSPGFFQRFSQTWPNKQLCRRQLYSTWAVLAGIGALPTAIVMLWGPELFGFVFGTPWREAGRIAVLLAPLLYVTFVAAPTSTNAIVMGLQKLCFQIDILLAVWRVISFLLVKQYGLEFGLIAWTWGEITIIVFRNLTVLNALYPPRILNGR